MNRYRVQNKVGGLTGNWCQSFSEAAFQALSAGLAEVVEIDIYGPVIRYDTRVMEIFSEHVDDTTNPAA